MFANPGGRIRRCYASPQTAVAAIVGFVPEDLTHKSLLLSPPDGIGHIPSWCCEDLLFYHGTGIWLNLFCIRRRNERPGHGLHIYSLICS